MSLVATVETVSSEVTSMVTSFNGLLNPHRSEAKSQPTPASSAESSTTHTRYKTGLIRRLRRFLGGGACRSLRRTSSLFQLAVSPRL